MDMMTVGDADRQHANLVLHVYQRGQQSQLPRNRRQPRGITSCRTTARAKTSRQIIAKINRFQIDHFAYLLARLRQVSEGNGTLLDHCMVVYGSGISDGDRHNHDDLAHHCLPGGGGGRIKTGPPHPLTRTAHRFATCIVWMMQQMGTKQGKFGDSTGVLDRLG